MKDKQARVLELLQGGSRWTVIDIAIKAKIGDPRSVIRNIRKQGVIVSDEWVNGKDAPYKRYWIDPAKQPAGLLERLQKGGAR